MDSLSSGSSKRTRPPVMGNLTVACSVDGCTADLSKCRDYHRRHRVCEQHSKTPKVTIGGHEQRFCQQCSRFHSLVEFDEGKRSCRKRLDGHNRRRRKPQPESFSINSGRFFTTHQGTRYLTFGGSQIFPPCSSSASTITSTGRSIARNSPVNTRNPVLLDYNSQSRQLNFMDDTQNSFTHSFTCSTGASGQQQQHSSFSQGPSLGFSETTTLGHPLVDHPKCTSANDQRKFYGGLHRPGVGAGSGSSSCSNHRALSLLSSPLPSETPQTGVGWCVSQTQPFPSSPELQYHHGAQAQAQQGHHFSCSQQRCVLDSDANFNCQEMFQNGPSSGGSHNMLSFSWD